MRRSVKKTGWYHDFKNGANGGEQFSNPGNVRRRKQMAENTGRRMSMISASEI